VSVKGSPDYYRERRERRELQAHAVKPEPRTVTVLCPSPACGLSFLSYHLKCPFCGCTSNVKD
jgi:hypothetical protein